MIKRLGRILRSLKTVYKSISIKVIGVYPGDINTNFYKNSRDYMPRKKQQTLMNPKYVAKVVLANVLNETNLTIADLIIERN